ncbi:MAG: hypothetical protein N2508_15690 [Anaerolineae bacterium]|nr:hypothetical protein [Anaerolineae bacterium]
MTTSPAIYPPSPLPFTPQPVTSDSFWQRLSPDVRAAVLTSFVVSGIQALSYIVPGLGFAFSAPFAVIAYYVQGIVAGKLAKSDARYRHFRPGDYARLGAMSAIWTSVVISTVLTLIVFAAQFALSLGNIVVLIPIILINRLTDIFLNVCFSTLGAWLYGRFGGQGVLGISVGVLGCGVTLMCLLSISILAILGAVGISIFQGISSWLSR